MWFIVYKTKMGAFMILACFCYQLVLGKSWGKDHFLSDKQNLPLFTASKLIKQLVNNLFHLSVVKKNLLWQKNK